MRTVYEPSNALEGHMLQDLLRQRGISSRVDGAQLQGGVGELPVSGFVRLVVDEDDYQSARTVIEEWESTVVPDPIPVPPSRSPRTFLGVLIGLALGIASTYAFFRMPVDINGIDHNEDGTLDERWEYAPGGAIVKLTLDRNFDTEVDFIQSYDRHGRATMADVDDNFDGTFESHWQFRRGNVEVAETDTNGDSYVDLRSIYQHGVLISEEHFLPRSEVPIRIEHYRLGRMVTAEVDTDRDGRLDTRYKYSDIAEVMSTEMIDEVD